MKKIVGFLVMGVVLMIAAGGFVYTRDPAFCGRCHLIEPFYKSWKEANHAGYGAGCIDCHYGPGMAGRIKGEVYTSVMFMKYAVGSYGQPTWRGLLINENCLECHPGVLDEEMILAGELPFYHREHVEVKGVECRSCHTAIGHPGAVASAVVGEPPKISQDICLRCHDEDTAPVVIGQPTASLRAHPGNPQIDTGIWKQEHWRAAAGSALIEGELVSIQPSECLACHTEPTEESGCQECHTVASTGYDPDAQSCLGCHEQAMNQEYSVYDLPFYHDKHLLHTQASCKDCHTRVTHDEICAGCHDGKSAPAIFTVR
jgi:cytochrome c nitrite reductase small subunit